MLRLFAFWANTTPPARYLLSSIRALRSDYVLAAVASLFTTSLQQLRAYASRIIYGAPQNHPSPIMNTINSRIQSIAPVKCAVDSRIQSIAPVKYTVDSRIQSIAPVKCAVDSRIQGIAPVKYTVDSRIQGIAPVKCTVDSRIQSIAPPGLALSSPFFARALRAA